MQPIHRAGINLHADPSQAALVAKLRADPNALTGARAELQSLADEDAKSKTSGRGSIFDRCYVSKAIHDALETALQQIEG